jgi:hypothetical protein
MKKMIRRLLKQATIGPAIQIFLFRSKAESGIDLPTFLKNSDAAYPAASFFSAGKSAGIRFELRVAFSQPMKA